MYFPKDLLFSRTLFFLATTVHIHFTFADEGRRPLITPAALMPRQDASCPAATDTACPDGTGCCPIGAACTWTRVTIPICATTCKPPVVYCAGAYSGVCCNAGSSCDYASQGMCTANGFIFSTPSVLIPSISTSSIVVPSLSSPPRSYSYQPLLTTSATVTSAEISSASFAETSSIENAGSSRPTSATTTATTTAKTTSTVVVVSTAGAGNGFEVGGKGLLELVIGGIVGLVLGV